MSESAADDEAADEDKHYRALRALGFPPRVARRMARARTKGAA